VSNAIHHTWHELESEWNDFVFCCFR
jgi:hypothetical protein